MSRKFDGRVDSSFSYSHVLPDAMIEPGSTCLRKATAHEIIKFAKHYFG